jgi:hypothetical protein
MNTYLSRYLPFLFLVLTGECAFAQGLLHELEQMSSINRLPEYTDLGYVEQFSSYDTTGNNDDGFGGKYSFLRIEGGNQVIAEMKGPGVINRIWTPTPSEDTIQFFFDGEESPRISLPFEDLFTSNRFPFLSPVCGHEVGGYYCYVPVPYSKSCKVVFHGKMLFYQLQYRSYPEKQQVKSFTMDWDAKETSALMQAVETWGSYGTNFLEKLYNDIKTKSELIRIRPGETKPVFTMEKGGRIIGLEMEGIDKLDRSDNLLVIRARWDDDRDWGINAPVKDLFGYFFGEKSMRSLLGGTAGNISYLYYPMPFKKSAQLELEYIDADGSPKEEIELLVRIFYMENPKQDNEGKLYAHWRRETNPTEGVPYSIMSQYFGKGHFVGTILICQGLVPGSTGYFEGDDQATIDGKLRLHGTGSEDYFNGGWYEIPDRWDMAHSLPSHGCLGYTSVQGRTGAYRHYFSDKLNFNEQFHLTIEHGPSGNKFPVDYRSVAFYYADKPLPQTSPDALMTVYPSLDTFIYRNFVFTIQAFRYGKLINGRNVGGARVLTFELDEGRDWMLAEFLLKVPADGKYKLYSSHFRTPSSGQVRYMQRQVPLTGWKDMYNDTVEHVVREYIGEVQVMDGMCTVTIHLHGKDTDQFILHQLILEEE